MLPWLDNEFTESLDSEWDPSVAFQLLKYSLLHLIKMKNIYIWLKGQVVCGGGLLELLDQSCNEDSSKIFWGGPLILDP